MPMLKVHILEINLVINLLNEKNCTYKKKNRLFYSYGRNNSYMIESGKLSKLNCEKKTTKGKVFAVSGASKPAPNILEVMKKYKVNSFTPMHSSYKFCVIATGEYDFYAARERAR